MNFMMLWYHLRAHSTTGKPVVFCLRPHKLFKFSIFALAVGSWQSAFFAGPNFGQQWKEIFDRSGLKKVSANKKKEYSSTDSGRYETCSGRYETWAKNPSKMAREELIRAGFLPVKWGIPASQPAGELLGYEDFILAKIKEWQKQVERNRLKYLKSRKRASSTASDRQKRVVFAVSDEGFSAYKRTVPRDVVCVRADGRRPEKPVKMSKKSEHRYAKVLEAINRNNQQLNPFQCSEIQTDGEYRELNSAINRDLVDKEVLKFHAVKMVSHKRMNSVRRKNPIGRGEASSQYYLRCVRIMQNQYKFFPKT